MSVKDQATISIRSAIITTFTTVAQEQGKALQTLTDDLALMDSGLDSLCIAIIVARLDDELNLDPFSRIYENAAG
jgi:hypothetical protein